MEKLKIGFLHLDIAPGSRGENAILRWLDDEQHRDDPESRIAKYIVMSVFSPALYIEIARLKTAQREQHLKCENGKSVEESTDPWSYKYCNPFGGGNRAAANRIETADDDAAPPVLPAPLSTAETDWTVLDNENAEDEFVAPQFFNMDATPATETASSTGPAARQRRRCWYTTDGYGAAKPGRN